MNSAEPTGAERAFLNRPGLHTRFAGFVDQGDGGHENHHFDPAAYPVPQNTGSLSGTAEKVRRIRFECVLILPFIGVHLSVCPIRDIGCISRFRDHNCAPETQYGGISAGVISSSLICDFLATSCDRARAVCDAHHGECAEARCAGGPFEHVRNPDRRRFGGCGLGSGLRGDRQHHGVRL